MMSLSKLSGPKFAQEFAGKDSQRKVDLVAKQFEEILLKSLVHTMRQSAKHESDGLLNAGSDVVQDMFESQLAQALAKTGSLGIADLISRGAARDMGVNAGTGINAGKALKDLGAKLEPWVGRAGQGAVRAITDSLTPRAQQALQLINKVVPGARLSSDFGLRNDPISGEPGHFHHGVDLAAALGSPVRSVAGGTVLRAEPIGNLGLAVYVDHGDGRVSRYGHLSASAVQPGQQVAAGEKLGEVGSSGRSTGPHLHFELRVKGKPIDPLQ